MVRRLITLMALAGAIVTSTAAIAWAGASGPAFYVDGVVYRTVGTPNDLSGTDAPEHSFDVIYEFFGAQPLNVATAAPGDTDYNGGRWKVHGLEFDDYDAAVAAYDTNSSGDFDNDAEVLAAIQGGAADDIGVVKQFVCPVIKMPQG